MPMQATRKGAGRVAAAIPSLADIIVAMPRIRRG